MELNHLRYFFEVARLKSFTKASRTLRVSQPSISKTVKNLESREGVKLFDRGKKGVTLTEEGKIFYESCQRVFGEIEHLQANIRVSREDCVGDLSFGASDNLCNYILPELLIQFWKQYPEVRIKIFSGVAETIKAEVLEDRAEFGLFYTPVDEKNLSAEKLCFVDFLLVCSTKNERLMAAKKFDPKIFEKSYFIGSRVKDYQKPYPTLLMLRALGIKPRLFFETNNHEAQKKMVMQEYGYTLLPRHMVRDELKVGKLKSFEFPKKIGRIGSWVYLVKNRGKTLSKPARVFEAFLKERLAAVLSR